VLNAEHLEVLLSPRFGVSSTTGNEDLVWLADQLNKLLVLLGPAALHPSGQGAPASGGWDCFAQTDMPAPAANQPDEPKAGDVKRAANSGAPAVSLPEPRGPILCDACHKIAYGDAKVNAAAPAANQPDEPKAGDVKRAERFCATFCTEQDDHDYPQHECKKCAEMEKRLAAEFAAIRRDALEEAEKRKWEPWTRADGTPLICTICKNEIPRCENGWMGDIDGIEVQHMDCGYQQQIKELQAELRALKDKQPAADKAEASEKGDRE